jgi:hypothetical protein
MFRKKARTGTLTQYFLQNRVRNKKKEEETKTFRTKFINKNKAETNKNCFKKKIFWQLFSRT